MNPTIYRIKELLGKEAGDMARACDEVEGRWLTVFTNPDVTELIGLLCKK